MTELTWCSTIQDDNWAQFEIRGLPTRRTSAAEGFKVLGTIRTFDNKFDQEIEYRLSRANAAFYANWHLLGCISIPLVTRLRVVRAVVDASISWCAGSWNLTRDQNEGAED